MPKLEKKTTETDLEDLVNNQAAQIKQMQLTIQDLQGKLKVSDKEKEVQRNIAAEKEKEAAINPQNLHKKLMASGHTPDVQEQILKNAN